MKIPIKQIITENILGSIGKRIHGLAQLGLRPANDSSSAMNSRSDKVMPLGADTLMSKAIGFKDKEHDMRTTKSLRDFNTGSQEGTEASAADLFRLTRAQELNKV